MSIPENERAAMAVLVSNLLIQQAIESRARKPESVWLPHSFERKDSNCR